MTTIHAVARGATSSARSYVSLVLRRPSDEPLPLMAPKDELRAALSETGGVGRFEVQIGDDPAIHHMVAQRVKPGPTPGSISQIVVQEVLDTSVVKLQVQLRVHGLPQAAMNHEAQVAQKRKHISVKGKFANMPASIDVDLTNLTTESPFLASSVELPTGVALASAPDELLFELRPVLETASA